jgi:hypothetical protein
MNGLISIIIVNFKAGRLLHECVKSIAEQQVDAEVIIVDNDSGDDDREILETLRQTFTFVKIILNKNNEGFSRANNQGLAVSRGSYVLFLNPDTFLFPSCLERLVSFLKMKMRVGCVTPRLWMDKAKTFLLPSSSLPTLLEIIRTRLSASSGFLLRSHRKTWLRRTLTFWDSEVPVTVSAVSGAFLMTERSILDGIGYFDERFPLYFEDSDLCMRMKKAGLKLWYYPGAEAVHYYNQSAKGSPESIQKFIASERLFVEKYYSPVGLKCLSLLNKLNRARTGFSGKPSVFSAPIKTPTDGYLLISPLETMIPCAAHRVTAEQFTFDREFVEKLTCGMYYALLVSRYGKIYKRFILEKR